MISVVIGCVRGWGVWGDHPLAFGKSKMADMVGFGKKFSEEVWKWSNIGWGGLGEYLDDRGGGRQVCPGDRLGGENTPLDVGKPRWQP